MVQIETLTTQEFQVEEEEDGVVHNIQWVKLSKTIWKSLSGPDYSQVGNSKSYPVHIS